MLINVKNNKKVNNLDFQISNQFMQKNFKNSKNLENRRTINPIHIKSIKFNRVHPNSYLDTVKLG
jgi:hypothetical protein